MLLALPTLPVDTHRDGVGTGRNFSRLVKISAPSGCSRTCEATAPSLRGVAVMWTLK